jgi:ABC-type Fe3+ transport system permease subunit
MKTRRFQTDRRLWFWIALTLFLACWFIPFFDVKGDQMSVFDGFREGVADSHLSFGIIVDGFFSVTFCAFLFTVPSIVLAWLIQCAVVIIRTRKRERIDHVA